MKVGDKIGFTKEFKERIEGWDEETRDVLYYVRNDTFEVKETKEGFIKVVGVDMWNWVNTELFNVL
jgi:hypothetical protein|tara:strand:- start:237 stop:434 length:198 start_codon:yes stop_codon:yes gene_type:complete